MQFRTLLDDNNAVSPVIGVILMVAITVILAAVIASFVLGLGQTSDPAPNPTLQWSQDGDNVTIDVTGGNTFQAGHVEVHGDIEGPGEDGDTWDVFDVDDDVDSESTISAGSTAEIEVSEDNWEIDLIWNPPGDDPEIIASQDG